MSLLRIINDPSIRTFLDKHITKPQIDCRKVAIVPALPGVNASRVGTAFDYVMRFALLARRGASAPPTIAERTVERLGAGEWPQIDVDVRAALAGRVREARAALEAIGTGRLLSHAAAEAALVLAGVDPLYRAGIADGLGREPEGLEIDDVTRLFRVVPWKDFTATSRLITNPSFGEGSRLVGGADADLIIDDLLVDLKVTVNLAVEPESIRQVVGYALLANRFGIDGIDGRAGIHRVGIYMARTRRLYAFRLRECLHSSSDSAVLEKILLFARTAAPGPGQAFVSGPVSHLGQT